MRVSRTCTRVALGLAAACAAAAVGVSSAAADPPPGSTPANPITEPSQPVYGQTVVHLWWPDGTSETAFSDQPPSLALDEAVIAARARAEGRAPSNGVSPSVSWGGGASACSESLAAPYKLSSTSVGTNAAVTCTADVYQLSGTLYLYRSSNFTLIGADTEYFSQNNGNWVTNGPCLSSTWQYNSETSFSAVSRYNGGVSWSDAAGPSWISC